MTEINLNKDININVKSSDLEVASRTPYWNHGNNFDLKSRKQFHLNGLLPSSIEDFKKQKERALLNLRRKQDPLEKYIFLANLRNTNLRLFYQLVLDHFKEITPLIYTPVVGKACQEYSNILPFLGSLGNPDGLFISINDLDNLDELLDNYKRALPYPKMDPEITVITDGSRILGLGDLGMNGMGIPVGKLQLYVGAAGINPSKTLPITLDFGTNNETLLEDPLYLGLKQKRPTEEVFYAATDKVLKAIKSKFPNILVQFEDFSSDHAFGLLEKHREELFCFNDDIQGTGAVILAGFINAIKRSEVPADQHRIVFLGAGSAGIGVARQIMDYFILDGKMSEDEAKRKFWLIDSKGLITTTRGDKLNKQKAFFARDDHEGPHLTKLLDIIEYVKPTALIGLSSISGAFNKEVLTKMGQLNTHPIIFPLSNPATAAECSFADAMEATESRALFASGTAFPEYKDEKTGKIYQPGQGNNMYIFPGLGLGAILSKPGKVTDKMIYAAASSLANSLTSEENEQGWLYPDITRLREVSARVAAATIQQAHKEGLVKVDKLLKIVEDFDKVVELAQKNMWVPNSEELNQDAIKYQASHL